MRVNDSDRLLASQPDAWTPEELAAAEAGMERLRATRPELHRVLVSHLGIGCQKRTLSEIGMDFGVCRERARQMEAEALRLLRRYASRIA